MSVDILGTNWDQCRSMVQYSFTSTEARRLVRTDSPGQPPRLSDSFWTMPFSRQSIVSLTVFLRSLHGTAENTFLSHQSNLRVVYSVPHCGLVASSPTQSRHVQGQRLGVWLQIVPRVKRMTTAGKNYQLKLLFLSERFLLYLSESIVLFTIGEVRSV